MKLILISPEGDDAREAAVLAELVAAGLERYHVRKPQWSFAKTAAWLGALPSSVRPRLVLHQHHELAESFGLLGRHWRDGESAPDAPRVRTDFTSRSCHTLTALRAALGCYRSVFLSPVFPSLSKPGYAREVDGNGLDLTRVKNVLADRTRDERSTEVIALGGITPDKLPLCAAACFDGVAALGYIWQAADPLRNFGQLQSSLFAHAS
jgi:thiamine-phosphate pyrophosphorylase